MEKSPIPAARVDKYRMIEIAHRYRPTRPWNNTPHQATVKGLTPQQLRDAGTQIILSNTYHLLVQPGSELVAGRVVFIQTTTPAAVVVFVSLSCVCVCACVECMTRWPSQTIACRGFAGRCVVVAAAAACTPPHPLTLTQSSKNKNNRAGRPPEIHGLAGAHAHRLGCVAVFFFIYFTRMCRCAHARSPRLLFLQRARSEQPDMHNTPKQQL